MFKVTQFERFAAGVDAAQAERYWADEVAAATRSLPGLVQAVQNRSVTTASLEGAVSGDGPFDGFSELWWHDEAAFERARSSREWEALQTARAEIFDVSWGSKGMAATIEERIQRVGFGAKDDGVSTPPGEWVKLIGLLIYRPDMTRDEANAYWAGTHTDFALQITEMGHYVQNHAIRPLTGDRLRFDGYSEAWFVDMDAYQAAMDDSPWKALAADGSNLFAMSEFGSAIVRERVVHGPVLDRASAEA